MICHGLSGGKIPPGKALDAENGESFSSPITPHGGILTLTLRAEASNFQYGVIRHLFSSLNHAPHALF